MHLFNVNCACEYSKPRLFLIFAGKEIEVFTDNTVYFGGQYLFIITKKTSAENMSKVVRISIPDITNHVHLKMLLETNFYGMSGPNSTFSICPINNKYTNFYVDEVNGDLVCFYENYSVFDLWRHSDITPKLYILPHVFKNTACSISNNILRFDTDSGVKTYDVSGEAPVQIKDTELLIQVADGRIFELSVDSKKYKVAKKSTTEEIATTFLDLDIPNETDYFELVNENIVIYKIGERITITRDNKIVLENTINFWPKVTLFGIYVRRDNSWELL